MKNVSATSAGRPRFYRALSAVCSALLVSAGLIASGSAAAAADATVTSGVELTDAFDCDGEQSCTVTVGADVTSSVGPEVADGRTVTLDLAGHAVAITGQRDHAGIGVPSGATLVIEDSVGGAALTTNGGDFGAGIGGNFNESAGSITINGGEVESVGGGLAAGIGGGRNGAGGDVTIGSGAAVTASGASATSTALGPGSGAEGLGSLSNAGTLTIPGESYVVIPDGVSVTNSGTITGEGTISNQGAIANTGTVDLSTLTVTGHNYSITFDANGGTDAPEGFPVFATTMEAGAKSLPSEQPTWPAHGFTGWYLSSAGDGQPVTERTELTSQSRTITFYAGWEQLPESQVTVISGTNPATDSDTVTFTATVDPVPTGGTVAFVDRDTVIEDCAAVPVDASGTATCAPSGLDAGEYVITGQFSGTESVSASTSDQLLQVVYSTRTGDVVAWGANVHDGGYDVPAPDHAGQIDVPTGLDDVIAVAAGSDHSLALTAAGTIVGWGGNRAGETDVPTSASDVVAIAAGSQYSTALRSDGTVVAWGRNDLGQTDVPAGLSDVVAIAAGDFHAAALKTDGSVVVWGYNNAGQQAVPDDLFATQISAGTFHSYAMTPQGAVVGWGDFARGQLSPPDGLAEATQVEAGGVWSLALTGGSLVAWGEGNSGQTNAPDLNDAVEISAGWYHGVARLDGGTVVAWGDDSAQQLSVPDGLERVYALSAGGAHTLALEWTPPVVNIVTTTSLTSSANPSTAGEEVTFTADVVSNPRGGSVTFTDGSTTLCGDVPIDADTGEATCAHTFTTDGSHSITAEFPGFEQYLASTSDPLTQQVGPEVTAPSITTESLPSGTVGTPYETTLAATGGTPPYTWDVDGDLPPGLHLSGTMISGEPTSTGSWAFTVTVTDANSQQDSQELTVTIDDASFSPERSTVTASPSSVRADGAATSTITVALLDADSSPVAGQEVTLTASGGSSAVSAPSGASDADGQVTFTVTDTVAEQVTYTATAGGVEIAQTAQVTFTAGPVSASASTVTASPTSAVADGEDASTITVTALDANGNPLADQLVSLTGTGSTEIREDTQFTDDDGIAAFVVTDTVAEQVTYTATVEGLTLVQSATVTFTAGAVSAVRSTVMATPESVVADGETSSTVTVTVTDANGNPLAGANVSLAAGGGSSTISAASGPAGGDGVVTFTVTNTVAEQVAYTASVGEVEIAQTATVTFTAGDVSASVSTMTASPTSVVADGESTSTITVTVLDANQNPVVGHSVSLAAGSGSSEVSEPGGLSDADGVVTFTVTNTVAEQVTYTATAGQTELAQTAAVNFTPGPVSAELSTVTAEPSSVVADGVAQAAIIVTLRDAFDNPIVNQHVALAADSTTVVFAPGSVTSEGVTTVLVSNTVAEQVTFTASAGGVEVAQTARVLFTPGAVSVSDSTLTAEPSTVVADGESASTITAVLLDSQGNPVPEQTVTLVADGGNSVISPAEATSATDGTVAFTVTDTTAEQVTYSAQVRTAVANARVLLLADADLTLQATATVTFIAGEVSASDSTLTAQPTTALADGTSTSTITATLLDAQGNAVAGEEVSLTADGGSSEITETTGTSAEDGTVTFEVTNEVAEQVTYRASVGELELEPRVTVTFVSEPSAPLNPGVSAGDAQVELTWDTPASDGESPLLGYQVYRSTEAGERGTLLTTDGPLEAAAYIDTAVENRTTYYYAITAVNAIGEGPAAEPVEATPFAPLLVTTEQLPGGQEGVAYSAELAATGGLVADYTWTLVAGALPPGLELSGDGMITGTPTSAGEYAFTIGVNNPAQADLVIVVEPADVLAPVPDEPPAEPEAPEGAADLPSTGSSPGPPIGLAALGIMAGLALLGLRAVLGRRRGSAG
ncbi:Ig-like domain-containing protein [Ruania alba]|uniref:Alpha-tubulin suppressor n=1 Tax=Ruania alba TaxID=648782 RepID=A0A1H5M9H3_9MICO|nr:invasin domain 3-containing protein [Ruania alba]SEE85996.1 Alpha-tubulin suppressor [Ruania alba]